ncbi:UNVERIFIED_ORG: hypothetical protein GCAPEGMB_00212 [Vibrio phage V07]
MKRVELHKKVVDKQAVLPDHSHVQVETYYHTYKGYMNYLTDLRGVDGDQYLLVTDDGRFVRVEEKHLNGQEQKQRKISGGLIDVRARLGLSGKDPDWYDCIWRNGKIVYKYRETDFVTEEHELVVGEIVDIYESNDFNGDYPHDATVVLSRPKQMVLEAYGKLVVFTVPKEPCGDSLVSDCGDYRIAGNYAGSEYNEELHS